MADTLKVNYVTKAKMKVTVDISKTGASRRR